MKKFENVLIASDLDGTLLNKQHVISKENMDSIEYFTQNGGIFTVATGRPPLSAIQILKDIKFSVPAILLNGSIIFDMTSQKPIVTKTLESDAFEITKDILSRFPNIGCEIFDVDDIYLVSDSEISQYHFKYMGKPAIIQKIEDIPSSDSWLKVNFTHGNSAELAKLESFVRENYSDKYQICYSCRQFFEITHKNARKDISLFEMSDEKGFNREHIYTIGDNFNDFDMIKNASKGFAPANAEQQIKDVAFCTVNDCDDSAIADVIKYLDSVY